MYVIEVSGLKKTYKNGFEAVKGIDFKIKKGEVFAFLGPNGAGKTTTVEILEGLRIKSGGIIKFFNHEVEKVDNSIKEKIGVVLQETKLMELLTVKETIKLFSSFYKRNVHYDEIIKTINLKEKGNTKVKNLSGGQYQRLAIGLALINDPEIIFLDEPTTGLDPQARRNVWNLIKQLKNIGKTVFLTTHYMEEAESLADQVCIIDHGKIIARGNVPELIDFMAKDESIIKIKIADLYENKLPDFPFEYFENANVYSIKTKNVVRDLPKILQWSKNNKIELKSIDIHNPNLEDLFIQLTGKDLRD